MAIIRGAFDVNETKLTHVAGAWGMRADTEEDVRDGLQSEPGFISPVNIVKKGVKSGHPVVVVADVSLRTVRNMYGGANKKHRDILNMNIDRDWKPDVEADIALAQPGMKNAQGHELIEKRGIEVGNIFQLGYHYSKLMHDAEYTNEQGRRQKYYMGCYGFGIDRTLAAIVEAHHDDKGIIWPEDIAPFRYYLARLGDDANVVQAADNLYKRLTSDGVLVLYDDRDLRPGEKFADADLMGIPYRIVVSPKLVSAGKLEIKARRSNDAEVVPTEELITRIQTGIQSPLSS